MVLTAGLHGIILAIGLILPIGMQNGFILFQGAVHKRWVNLLPTLITAGMADTLLISLGAMGVSAAAFHITWFRYLIGVVGILFLLYMGVASWRDQGAEAAGLTDTAWPPRRQITFSLSVSLLNPHALIDTLAVIGGSASVYTTFRERFAFAAAAASVSWIWFFLLSLIGHWLGRMAFQNSLKLFNRVSAVIMWLSAGYLGYLIINFP